MKGWCQTLIVLQLVKLLQIVGSNDSKLSTKFKQPHMNSPTNVKFYPLVYRGDNFRVGALPYG